MVRNRIICFDSLTEISRNATQVNIVNFKLSDSDSTEELDDVNTSDVEITYNYTYTVYIITHRHIHTLTIDSILQTTFRFQLLHYHSDPWLPGIFTNLLIYLLKINQSCR